MSFTATKHVVREAGKVCKRGYRSIQPWRSSPLNKATTGNGQTLKYRAHLSTLEGHHAGSLGKPLVPADGHPYLPETGIEDLEARVPRVKVELFL